MTKSVLSPLRTRQPRPRVGHIDYLNCAPILWGLARTGKLLDMDMTKATPDQLGTAITEDRVDISPVSLVEFLRHQNELALLPGIAIGSDGPVMSCIIVSRIPLDRLDGAPVALGSESRTSVRLAQLLLAEMIGVEAEYFSCKPDLHQMLSSAPAAVLIGDAALRVTADYHRRLGVKVYDLGQMWHEWTGHPFVFAVVAARRQFVQEQPELVSEVHAALIEAKDLALAEIDDVSRRTARWTEFDSDLLRRYYTRALNYGLGARQRTGIAEFARRIGLPDLGGKAPQDMSWSI